MYVAALHEGKVRVEAQARHGLLNAWLEKGVEQLWIDLSEPSPEDLVTLAALFHLHPLAIEECEHVGVRPKIEDFGHYLYIVLHGLNHNAGEDRLDTVEFKFFLWRGHLISVHNRPSTSIRATQEYLQRHPDLLAREGVDSVLHRIVDAMIDHYFPLLEQIEDRVETIESEIFRDCSPALLEEMLRLRRQSFTLYRLLQPQIESLGALATGRAASIDAEDLPYFRDVYDHLVRINDRAHAVREMLTATMECYLSQSANTTNAVMKSLAVLATVLLPVTFVSGLMGMSLDRLPGKSSPMTFWAICSGAILTSAVILLVLRRMRWL
jgi:magnesium transporter